MKPRSVVSREEWLDSRGLDMLNGSYHMLDLCPKGRDEEGLDYSMAWLRLHDAYGESGR